ncbi:unnamed protein product [Sphagnum balticum]
MRAVPHALPRQDSALPLQEPLLRSGKGEEHQSQVVRLEDAQLGLTLQHASQQNQYAKVVGSRLRGGGGASLCAVDEMQGAPLASEHVL